MNAQNSPKIAFLDFGDKILDRIPKLEIRGGRESDLGIADSKYTQNIRIVYKWA